MKVKDVEEEKKELEEKLKRFRKIDVFKSVTNNSKEFENEEKKEKTILEEDSSFFQKVKSFSSSIKTAVYNFDVFKNWSFGDLFFGLGYFFESDEESIESRKKDIENFRLNSVKLTEKEAKELKYFSSVLRKGFKKIKKVTNETNVNKFVIKNNENILYYDLFSKRKRCGFILYNSEDIKTLMLLFRGTKSFNDYLIDLECETFHFEKEFYIHKGFLKTSLEFYNDEFLMGLIEDVLFNNPGYKFRVIGHSLGGAVGSILTVMLLKKFPMFDIKSVNFGSPPIFSPLISKCYEDVITNVVLEDDAIPRVCKYSCSKLRERIKNSGWEMKLEKDLKLKKGNAFFRLFGKVYKKMEKKTEEKETEKVEKIETKDENEEIEKKFPKLHVAGRIIHFRTIEENIFARETFDRREFETIYYSKSSRKDHKLKNYKNLLKIFYEKNFGEKKKE